MHLFRDRARTADPMWEVAAATQILVADAETVTRLARETTLVELDRIEAVLVATRHPTGWFVHAVRRVDLPDAHVHPLRELVTVRTYLLLTQGPQPPAWRPAPEPGQWRSISLSPARELAELDDALVD